jgi:GTP-binding protein EngB required for normal cell division
MGRPSQPLRLLLAAALVLGVATLLVTLLGAADSALSIWQRLQGLPAWMRWAYGVLLVALAAGSGWVVWRLLHPRAARAPRAQPIDRAALEARIGGLVAASESAAGARRELEELDARRATGVVQVALFGEISTGKSSLLRALAPHAEAGVGVTGGTTREVARHRGELPGGRVLEVADVPGTQEFRGESHAAMARAEAARSHAVVYVADGDLTRLQDAELRALAGFGRPLLLVLNKADRYRDEERAALLARLRERYAALPARVLVASAGHVEEIARELPDGRRETVRRERGADVSALPH